MDNSTSRYQSAHFPVGAKRRGRVHAFVRVHADPKLRTWVAHVLCRNMKIAPLDWVHRNGFPSERAAKNWVRRVLCELGLLL